MPYRKQTKSEYAMASKEYRLSELFFQGISKFIQPATILLILTAGSCILLILLNVITGEELFIEAIAYVGSFMMFTIAVIPIPIIGIITFSIYLMRSLVQASKFFKQSKDIVESFDMIMKRTKYVHKLISLTIRMDRFISFFLTAKSVTKINIYLQKYIHVLLDFLLDLRSDLATRLTEQQEILEGAKNEVEQNMTGTPELLAVSQLQKTRLDRQIEQFEELQRVLVRV